MNLLLRSFIRTHPRRGLAPFVWLLCFFVLGISPAHSAPAPFRVAVVVPDSRRSETQVIKGLRDQLKTMAYQEGKNLTLMIDDAKNDRSAVKSMLEKLIGARFDVIVTTGTRTTLTAKALTQELPIVFTHPADPVSAGLVADFSRPGGNITGVAGLALQSTEKRLAMLKAMLPKLERVLIFYDASNASSRENFARGQAAATQLAIGTVGYGVKSADELKSTLTKLAARDGEALFHVADDLVEGEAEFVLDMARQKKLPSIFNDDQWASQGALASYGPSYYQMGRQAAQMIDKILRGQKPGALAVEPVGKYDFVINFRAVRAMGLNLPPTVIKQADRIIR